MNPKIEAIYQTREKIDDTLSTPQDYLEFCKRIDELADSMGEPTFEKWKESKGDD